MSFLADESVDKPVVDRLRSSGHSVQYVAEMEPGIADQEVLELANRERMLLLTADKDFGELVFRQGRLTQGVILLRLGGLSLTRKAELVDLAISRHETELSQAFTVITPGIVRIRRRIT